MLRLFAIATLLLWRTLPAQPPPGYYDDAQGLTGPALHQTLYGIISPHTVLPNSAIWAAYESTDKKPDGTVWDMYSDVPSGVPAYAFNFVVDQCGTYSGEGDCFNREHSFPQSWYGNAAPMSTDLFHLYPADAWVNQQRGNWPYGTVTQPNWTSINGSKRGPCTWPGCQGTVFEPIDAYKGDLARSYFYMLTRYLPQLPGWDSPMLFAGEFVPWAESLLVAWHLNDPVSTKETARNDAVFALQGNRNPFIDNPRWVERIWGPTASVEDVALMPLRAWVFNGSLHIADQTGTVPIELHLLDVTGRSIATARIDAAITPLPVSLSPGTYAAILLHGEQRTIVRFVH